MTARAALHTTLSATAVFDSRRSWWPRLPLCCPPPACRCRCSLPTHATCGTQRALERTVHRWVFEAEGIESVE